MYSRSLFRFSIERSLPGPDGLHIMKSFDRNYDPFLDAIEEAAERDVDDDILDAIEEAVDALWVADEALKKCNDGSNGNDPNKDDLAEYDYSLFPKWFFGRLIFVLANFAFQAVACSYLLSPTDAVLWSCLIAYWHFCIYLLFTCKKMQQHIEVLKTKAFREAIGLPMK